MNKHVTIEGANAPNRGGSVRSRVETLSPATRAIRRGFSPLLWLFFIFVFAAQTAWAQDENFPAGNGEGTSLNPYQITSVEELALLATLINEGSATYNAAHYKLMDNLDLDVAPYNADRGWTAIGSFVADNSPDNHPFHGVFDGNNKVVTGLYIKTTENAATADKKGLFGFVVRGEIKNLAITNANINARGQNGILAGYAQAGVFTNCSTGGVLVGTSGSSFGGLIGQLQGLADQGCTVNNCYSTATVTNDPGWSGNGGLIGDCRGADADHLNVITNCYATGDVKGLHETGGLLGYVLNTSISSCYATGNVTIAQTNRDVVGGLVGRFGGTMENCYATGAVRGGRHVVGGLIGMITANATVQNCYATGKVTSGYNSAGGIVGEIANTVTLTLKNCVALNPSVTADQNKGRIVGNPIGTAILSDNIAFSGMLNIHVDGIRIDAWAGSGHDHKNGASKTAAEIKAADFFYTAFTGNKSAWTFATALLPGLNGAAFAMPDHLETEPFALNVTDEYVFPEENPGYTSVTPLTVTITNNLATAIGPLTIELAGENFVLSETAIETIAASDAASFTLTPKIGLSIGIYKAVVKVTESVSGFYTDFNVTFSVANTVDVSWYDEGETTFRISSAIELAGLAQLVSEGKTFTGKTVILNNDINLSAWNSGYGWTRIGVSETMSFRGVFDGNNKVITGLWIDNGATANVGLFGVAVGAEIKNLGVTGANIVNAGTVTGMLVGRADNCIIKNCYASGNVNTASDNTGGLIGQVNAGVVIENCHTAGTVKGRANVGGLIGQTNGLTGNCINACYSTVTINATGANIGGLLGTFGCALNSEATIENCFVTGAVTGSGNYIGGLIGCFTGNYPGTADRVTVIVRNCYVTGTVVAGSGLSIGGLVGGCAVGEKTNNTITNCAALNFSISGGGSTGRVLGGTSPLTILANNVAWSGMTLTPAAAAGDKNGTSKTVTEINAANFFQTVFTGNLSVWKFAEGMLPGLNGQAMDLPVHLKLESFVLSEKSDYTFPNVQPGYAPVTPLTVTITNKYATAIGPMTIALGGANAEGYELSATSITSIAASSNATFTISPKTGLDFGIYRAVVTVSEIVGYQESFNVIFSVANDGYTGTPNVSWYNDAETTFRINNPDEMAGFAKLVNEGKTFAGKTVILDKDIDLSLYGQGANGGRGWTTIGSFAADNSPDNRPFQGIFDGNNKVVSGLYINTTEGAATADKKGLFAFVVRGEIKNLSIANADIHARGQNGILIGYVQGGTITNCSTSGTLLGNCGGSTFGGLVGQLQGLADQACIVSNCHSSATVTNDTGWSHNGGLLGDCIANAGNPNLITNCSATGAVAGMHQTGSLVGYASNTNISFSYATGNVNSPRETIGGLVGEAISCNILSCFATGNVATTGTTRIDIGGLAGKVSGKIENCYATGEVKGGANNSGGIAGSATDAIITNCAALNPSVQSNGSITGRVVANPTTGTLFTANVAYGGMTLSPAAAAGDKNGTDKTVSEINAEGFFQSVFTGDVSAWTFAARKLPGLNGEAVEMPEHLILVIQAQAPNIITHPQNSQVTVGNTHTLSVLAESVDGGELSFKWYSNTSASNEGGTLISTATSATYQPNTATVGKYYFYVVVTNTIDDNGVEKTAFVASNAATLEVTSIPTYAVVVVAGTGATGNGSFTAGTTVNITAGTAPIGMTFNHWTSEPAVEFANPNTSGTSFTMIAQPVTVTAVFEAARYTVTLTVRKDNAAWNAHGKTFMLKSGEQEELMTGDNATVTATVLNGTWKVYDGDTDTGATVVINNAAGNTTLNYYTVTYSVEEYTASGSVITATYGGNAISSGAVVLGGATLTITAVGANTGKDSYIYEWSGTASGMEATYTTVVNAAVNAICSVIGNRITGVENPLQTNSLKAWTNNGTLYVSGMTEGKVWKLYNVSGSLVKQGIANSDVTTISLNLSGVYIIQSEGNTLKFVY